MVDFSIIIGGKAGFGIDRASVIIGRLFNQLGYRIYIYRDYPSLIRGGHTFSVIRVSSDRIAAHRSKIDFLLALNQDTLDLHRDKLKDGCFFLYDPELVKVPGQACGVGVAIGKILKEENAPEIMRNTCIIGALCKAVGIDAKTMEDVLRKEIPRELELNLKVASRGFGESRELTRVEPLVRERLPVVSGNEAIGLGLVKGGLNFYVAYPMTPSSPILHFLAEKATEFGIKVIHPESEIAVILMALGFAYMGKKTAVGTSGGGFCLMTEGLSFAGMAELPVVIVMGQRPGPSTGLPTYSSQTELHFVLNAGQGEFPRFVAAPGDAEEAYYWSAAAMNIAWKYQIPSFILSDKNLAEGIFNFDINSVEPIKEENPLLWDKTSPYKRYLNTESGVSPLAFPPEQGAPIKVNSYEHDESGITTEEPATAKTMTEKRLRKEKYLSGELEGYKTINVYGNKDSSTAILCWGSNKGVCVEAAKNTDLKVIQPVVLWPFPADRFRDELKGVKTLISVEDNATGQLARLVKAFGFDVDEQILKYDGRPFSVDGLEEELKKWTRKT